MTKENKDVKGGKILSAPQSAAKSVRPAPLTNSVIEKLLGAYKDHVVIYNHKKHELTPKKYHGQKVYWDNDDTKNAAAAKEYFDASFGNIKVVATLSMQVAKIDYPGPAKWTESGKKLTPTVDGECTVCNYIVLNEETNCFELWRPDSWLGAGDHGDPNLAARFGACNVACFGPLLTVFLAAVLRARVERTL